MSEKIKIINPYDDIDYIDLEPEDSGEDLTRVRSLQVGFGSKVLRIDQDGLWMGAKRFADAPFSVDMLGNMVATSLDLSGYLQTGEALGDIGAGNITGTYIANGTIDTAQLNANAINGMTITGALIRTSSSGARVIMDDTTDSIKVYDASSDVRMALDQDELIFYGTGGTRRGALYADTTNLNLENDNGGYVVLNVTSTSYGIVFNIAGTTKASVTNAGLGVNDDIIANAAGIDIGSTAQPFEDFYIDDIRMTSQTSNPTADGMLRYYDSGGTEGLRMQFGGSDFQFDATGV